MNGKVFRDSTNVYQDQARVLFDYYRKAAEQIVKEEMRIEGEISSASEAIQGANRELASLQPKKIAAFAGGAALLLLFFAIKWLALLPALGAVIFGLMMHFKANALEQALKELQTKIEGFRAAHKNIRRDFKVTKLGLAYVPVARQIPFEGKSFIIDLTGSSPNQEFRLSSVRRRELFASTISELEESLREAPVVEPSAEIEEVHTDKYSRSIQNVSYYDYLGALDRKLRSAAYCLEDLDTTAVELPTISPQSEMAAYLATHSTDDPLGAPVFVPFATDRFDTEVETFQALNEMKKSLERHSVQFEEVLRRLMLNMAQSVQAVSRLKVASTGRLIDQSNRLLFTLLKASYNHYSPSLEAEEIERIRTESFDYQDSVETYRPFQLKQSSRVHYDLVSECWIAEDGSRTNVPFGMNQIQEEIVAPIVQSLMAETRLERLHIYNAIRDQKIDYLNQWHRDTEDFYGRNRAESSDLINLMRTTFSEFVANYSALNALEQTEKSMSASGSLEDTVTRAGGDAGEVIASYELKSREFQAVQDDFADYMDRLKEDIERRAAKFGFIEYYDASLRDSGARSFAKASSSAHTIEDRRRPLLAVNAYFASASELPPSPSVEPSAYENLSLNLESMARSALAELAPRGEEPLELAQGPAPVATEDNHGEL